MFYYMDHRWAIHNPYLWTEEDYKLYISSPCSNGLPIFFNFLVLQAVFSFSKLHLLLNEPYKISGYNSIGKNFSGCQTLEEFLEILNSPNPESRHESY